MTQTQTRLGWLITQHTTVKRRPAALHDLGFSEKVATSPHRIVLKSYAADAPGENLQGHLKVELAEPCHGTTTWYVESQYCQVAQEPFEPPIAAAPLKTSQPTSTTPAAIPPGAPSSGKINDAGLNLIKQSEGLELEAYVCPAGVLTIGYGTTKDVYAGQRITQAEAEAFLRRDVERFEQAVRELVKVPLTSNQFSALVSFVYNVGEGAFADSTLLKKLNERDYQGAAEQFLRWVKGDGGESLPGLVTRREAERKLFLTS